MARRDLLPLALTSAGLVAWQSLVVPRLPASPRIRTPVHLAAAATLLAVARGRGHRWADLGLDPDRVRSGLRHGAAALGACAAAYAGAMLLPPGRDEAMGLPRQEVAELLEDVVLHIPVGTVLAEEVVFRGVLHAEAERALGGAAARAWTAVVFALWHLEPALAGGRRSTRPLLHLAGTLVVTGLGDLVMGGLRRRAGSLLAPAGLHLGTNALGLLAAYARHRGVALPSRR